jgi:hypothetical protein
VNPQMQLFQPTAKLSDVPLLVRLAAAERIMDADPGMTRDQRAELLIAVVAPGLIEAVER